MAEKNPHAALIKFGLAQDAVVHMADSGVREALTIMAYRHTPDQHVSFDLTEEKAMELAKDIVEYVKKRRKQRAKVHRSVERDRKRCQSSQ